MALPLIKTLTECVDFEKTVNAFTFQLPMLPQAFSKAFFGSSSLPQLYLSTNPLISGLTLSVLLSPIFLIVSEINGNYSQVDRFWSVLPCIYSLHYAVFAHLSGIPTARTDLALAVQLVWGARLTFNYWRRGGYQIGSEDYRWKIVKDYLGQPLFFLLNVIFISVAQSLLLFTMTTPQYVLLLSSQVERMLTPVDYAFAAGVVACVALSATADQQQWNFHNAKAQFQKTAKVPSGWARAAFDQGFNTTGLFKYSRHPNFAAEQAVWITFFLWSCQVTHVPVAKNWTIVAPILYLILFQASTWLTELLSGQKYPEYKEYQKQVGMFVPSPFSSWSGPRAKGGAKKKQ